MFRYDHFALSPLFDLPCLKWINQISFFSLQYFVYKKKMHNNINITAYSLHKDSEAPSTFSWNFNPYFSDRKAIFKFPVLSIS